MSPGAQADEGKGQSDRGGGERSGSRRRRDTLYLVRHAKALPRYSTPGPDLERSLSPAGFAQAQTVAKRLGRERPPAITRVLSSPAARCRQTVAPLAKSLGLAIETVDYLFEGTDPQLALEALAEVAAKAGGARPAGSVAACTHGDVMTGIVEIVAASVDLGGDRAVAKGATWVLELDGGKVVGARYLPAP